MCFELIILYRSESARPGCGIPIRIRQESDPIRIHNTSVRSTVSHVISGPNTIKTTKLCTYAHRTKWSLVRPFWGRWPTVCTH